MDQFRAALPEEVSDCFGLIRMGQQYQRAQGFTQWTEAYPNESTIARDIEAGSGKVLCIDGRIAAYICISLEPEPAYDSLIGSWHSDRRYAVLNRLAISDAFRGRGLAYKIMELSEQYVLKQGIDYIRTNTAPENRLMQHIFEVCGYSFCGELDFRGGKKIAYDKLLN